MHYIKLRMDPNEARLLAVALLEAKAKGEQVGDVDGILDKLMMAGVITSVERWSYKTTPQQVA